MSHFSVQSRRAAFAILAVSVGFVFSTTAAFAQNAVAPAKDLMPQTIVQYGDDATATGSEDIAGRLLSTAPTHPQLSLTPDKTEILRLDQDAGTIIVGNPNQLSVVMETPRSLLLVPRQPGSTFLRILDPEGKVMMQRHIAVATAAKSYVRIRRSCNGMGGCEETSVYYCPDTCHAVDLVTTNAGSGSIAGMPVVSTPDIDGEATIEETTTPAPEAATEAPPEAQDIDMDAEDNPDKKPEQAPEDNEDDQ
ncbi:pilus assembly protein N-terminal domain-containing protein [Micavibrio aeruginosavorus]|uniref:pilus assembly protein N-terminal domain-containing protein n=1 Tax=Micavibrio aeruginosavorus TaxID=349221 RepID=UPI003F4AB4A2